MGFHHAADHFRFQRFDFVSLTEQVQRFLRLPVKQCQAALNAQTVRRAGVVRKKISGKFGQFLVEVLRAPRVSTVDRQFEVRQLDFGLGQLRRHPDRLGESLVRLHALAFFEQGESQAVVCFA